MSPHSPSACIGTVCLPFRGDRQAEPQPNWFSLSSSPRTKPELWCTVLSRSLGPRPLSRVLPAECQAASFPPRVACVANPSLLLGQRVSSCSPLEEKLGLGYWEKLGFLLLASVMALWLFPPSPNEPCWVPGTILPSSVTSSRTPGVGVHLPLAGGDEANCPPQPHMPRWQDCEWIS